MRVQAAFYLKRPANSAVCTNTVELPKVRYVATFAVFAAIFLVYASRMHRTANAYAARHAAPALAQLNTALIPASEPGRGEAGKDAYTRESLRDGTLADWKAATYERRLATTSDWTRRIGSSSMMRKRTRDADSTKRFAESLEVCISTAASSASAVVLANPAADIAVSCAVTLNRR
jgi:hypothetical protein